MARLRRWRMESHLPDSVERFSRTCAHVLSLLESFGGDVRAPNWMPESAILVTFGRDHAMSFLKTNIAALRYLPRKQIQCVMNAIWRGQIVVCHQVGFLDE